MPVFYRTSLYTGTGGGTSASTKPVNCCRKDNINHEEAKKNIKNKMASVTRKHDREKEEKIIQLPKEGLLIHGREAAKQVPPRWRERVRGFHKNGSGKIRPTECK